MQFKIGSSTLQSSLTSAVSVVALQHQVKLASLEDSCMLAVQACGRDNFPFLRAASGSSPFFYMYRCLFEVLGLILPLTAFQCALLEDSNVAPSQLHPNSWAMVRAFEILCTFFNIRFSVLVFLFFFQMKAN
ncbi:hypothetical protein JHK86_050198 [Glycine max]|nr:hypothetical protein JHK86_050198 [Glycine max]